MTDLVEKLKRERDEARAEATRWRLEGEGLLRYASEAVSEAFQRSAEAMREAAAQDCIDFWGKGHLSGTLQAARVRALPLPDEGQAWARSLTS
jgi:hypothetical protein